MSGGRPRAGGRVSYLYAVLPRPAGDRLPRPLTGLADAPVHLVGHGRLAAAVSALPADDHDEQALRAHLEDLDRLTAMARAHHRVVERLSALGPVLPFRLATVYLDDARVRAVLRASADDFAEALTRLDGRVELGVKVFALGGPPEGAPAPAPPPAPGASAAPGSGAAYLARRRAERRLREETWQRAARLAGRLDDELRPLAEAGRALRPQRAEPAGAAGVAGENVWNHAYLLRAERTEAFTALVRALAAGEDGLRVEVTGPWAPYSFAAPPEPGGVPS
ncbi:GvpL/GvpF family gas vesicle protein [Allostreptomyces psammosilenae]|uniref:Gas vesicle protein n=1 Tax=Allostreptomyces psammosilenae TaxID=1892865 RepID=A0A853A6E8_9ACTN|nr:GvpL/GvpF family gas vesicle protein [Allostreptomyces psammosilenae]NYI06118.1 hypothetical protein [Allostreptomyces psammosilenae]